MMGIYGHVCTLHICNRGWVSEYMYIYTNVHVHVNIESGQK